MPRTRDVTQVIFRRFPDGDAIAIFPYELYHCDGDIDWVMSYQHVGQHGGCHRGVLHATKPANESDKDIISLQLELVSLGYTLKVLKRYPKRRRVREYLAVQAALKQSK